MTPEQWIRISLPFAKKITLIGEKKYEVQLNEWKFKIVEVKGDKLRTIQTFEKRHCK